MRFRASIQVAARPEDVFAVLGDYRQDPRWRRGVVTMRPQPPGPARAGTTTGEVIRFMGITTRTPGQVTAVVPGELLAWRAEGARLAAVGTRRVERAPDGGRVTLTTEIRLRGAWRAFEPLLTLVYKRQLRGDLTRLKNLIEGR
jgi:uncharacterized protein YndB with AHSA1/START domain